jgi:hypothetical protein
MLKLNTLWVQIETFTLPAPDNAVINLTGAVTFGVAFWAGPLFVITGNNVTCKPSRSSFPLSVSSPTPIVNGNGHEFLVRIFELSKTFIH